ncbi:MAG: hypothetical protein GF400_02300 [Candidatus Eisenbacteria bacterium]|nr:hypothetical protein [Candidatus Eisenbacteria bacterium]
MGEDKKARKAELKAEKKRAKAEAKRAKSESHTSGSGKSGDLASPAESQVGSPVSRGSSSRAPLRRLVGQGVFQLVIKIVAGLIVAYVLFRLGMRQ